MQTEKIQEIFFFIILVASVVLAFSLAYPFLGALTISLSLAIAFRPMFRSFVRKFGGKRTPAAWLSLVVIILIVIIPLSLIGIKVFNEIGNLYISYLSGENDGGLLNNLPASANDWLNKVAPGVNFDLQVYAEKGIEWLFTNLNDIFSSAIRIIFNLFIIFITLFYLFRDGNKFRQVIHRLSPLADKEDSAILGQLELTISSIVRGTIVIALLQGLLAGLGFYLFGLPEPVLWAILATIASILPGFGTGLVLVPLVIYLAMAGSYGNAIGLTIWGAVVVGLVDNLLRPLLLERAIKIHPLLIFLSVLGGLSIFGALGFILGPIILSFAFSLGHIYLSRDKKNDK